MEWYDWGVRVEASWSWSFTLVLHSRSDWCHRLYRLHIANAVKICVSIPQTVVHRKRFLTSVRCSSVEFTVCAYFYCLVCSLHCVTCGMEVDGGYRDIRSIGSATIVLWNLFLNLLRCLSAGVVQTPNQFWIPTDCDDLVHGFDVYVLKLLCEHCSIAAVPFEQDSNSGRSL